MTDRNQGVGGIGSPDRGVSEIIGLVLLFAFVIAGASLILLSSAALQDDTREQQGFEMSRTTMQELNSQMETLTHDKPQFVSLDLSELDDPGAMTVREGTGEVEFVINENPNCKATASMGSIEQQHDGNRELVHEAGAIWQVVDGQVVDIVSPPALNYRRGTIEFVLSEFSGEITTGNLRATQDVQTSTKQTRQHEIDLVTRDGTRGTREECMLRSNLTVVVDSSYHEGWAEYMRQEFPAENVTHDESNGEAELFLGEPDLMPFDSDDDGVADRVDNCQVIYNPDQDDTSNNGTGDACEEDIDADDVPNHLDNCPFMPNPSQSDTSGDDVGDACSPDISGDGVPNHMDNCFKDYNPNQNDTNGNGIGDVCYPDIDGDGTPNDHITSVTNPDNCPFTFNPLQFDTDGDGVGDACDPDTGNYTNPNVFWETAWEPPECDPAATPDFQPHMRYDNGKAAPGIPKSLHPGCVPVEPIDVRFPNAPDPKTDVLRIEVVYIDIEK